MVPMRGIEARLRAAAHRRAAPRHGDLAATCAPLTSFSDLAAIKRRSNSVGSPRRGPPMRGLY